jgi:uncharacterized protein with HEPN domain
MRSDTAVTALRDIAHHIDLALSFTAGFDYEAFVADARAVYAVTRCLEIFSEASRRLPDDLKVRHPSIAWRDMPGAGNIYCHDYEDVAAQYVWDTVQIGPLSSHTGPCARSATSETCQGTGPRAIAGPVG